MKRRKKAIKRAERRGAREWSRKYIDTYAAVMADRDERLRELDAEGERLRDVGCIACPSISEAQMEAKGLERELAAAVRAREDVEDERDRLTAELDRLRHGERERLNDGTGMLRACNKKLQADVVQLTAERNYYIDSLSTERGEWQRTITQEQASTRAGWARADELREQRESLRERVEELQAENARLHDQLVNYSVVSEHTEQSLRDAKLGRLVRAMPGGLELYRTERGTPWRTAYLGDREPRFGETPEEALEAAGIACPPVPNADAGLWRYAEERRLARLGATVEAMPEEWSLTRDGPELYCVADEYSVRKYGTTPQEALESAGVTVPPVPNADRLMQWLDDAKNWQCPICHERIQSVTGNARWNGRAWEHRCAGTNAQCGYTEAVRVSADHAEQKRAATLTGADVVAGSGEDGY